MCVSCDPFTSGVETGIASAAKDLSVPQPRRGRSGRRDLAACILASFSWRPRRDAPCGPWKAGGSGKRCPIEIAPPDPTLLSLVARPRPPAWVAQLLEAEVQKSRSVPASAKPLWTSPDESSGQDVLRVLCRLFVSDRDLDGGEAPDQARPPIPTGSSGGGEAKPAKASGVPSMASIAFPSLIARYCSGVAKSASWAGGGGEWLESDEATCRALEEDVHALALLGFVEWREFVTALPGCGEVLSRETSALWLAQVRMRTAGPRAPASRGDERLRVCPSLSPLHAPAFSSGPLAACTAVSYPWVDRPPEPGSGPTRNFSIPRVPVG